MKSALASTMPFIGQVSNLSNFEIAAAVAGHLFGIYLMFVLRRWYRLSHVPGPFWAGFSRYWGLRELMKGRQPSAYKAANDKYGNFCSLSIRLSSVFFFVENKNRKSTGAY